MWWTALIEAGKGVLGGASEVVFDGPSDAAATRANILQLRAAATQEEALATDAVRQAVMQGGFARMEGSLAVGAQRVAYEASGIDSGTGTAARLQDFTQAQADFSGLVAVNNGVRAALGHRQTASNYRQQVQAEKEGYDARMRARWMRAIPLAEVGVGFAVQRDKEGATFAGGLE